MDEKKLARRLFYAIHHWSDFEEIEHHEESLFVKKMCPKCNKYQHFWIMVIGEEQINQILEEADDELDS